MSISHVHFSCPFLMFNRLLHLNNWPSKCPFHRQRRCQIGIFLFFTLFFPIFALFIISFSWFSHVSEPDTKFFFIFCLSTGPRLQKNFQLGLDKVQKLHNQLHHCASLLKIVEIFHFIKKNCALIIWDLVPRKKNFDSCDNFNRIVHLPQ